MYDDPNTPHFMKARYYSERPEIVEESTTIANGTPPQFSALAISFRGCMSPASANDMLALGLSKHDLAFLTAITVEQGAVIHRQFMLSTARAITG